MSRRNKELSMRKNREILRLPMCCGLGNREVARSCGISHTVVNRHISRARGAGLSYQRQNQRRLFYTIYNHLFCLDDGDRLKLLL